jgi:chaperonin GroEL
MWKPSMQTKVVNNPLEWKKGLDLVADTVKHTLGVKGKSIALDTDPYGRLTITNDGVTIARNISHADREKNIGVKLIKEAAEKTNDNAGDGTTSTMLLMQAIVDAGMKAIASGADGIDLRKGIQKATRQMVKYLQTERVDATDLDSLAAVATISCRDPKIGRMIAEVTTKAGKEGIVTIEDRMESDTVFDRQEGLKLTGGFLSEEYINLPQRQQVVFNDPLILTTTRVLSLGEEMGKIMEIVANAGKKEAVIIANGIEGAALMTSFINWKKQAIYVLPIRVITYGDLGLGMLKDVAAITDATFLDENEPKTFFDLTLNDFGHAKKIVVDRHSTTVIADDSALKTDRLKELKTALKNEALTPFERENLEHRVAKLNSAMFTIKVGGKTDTERNELKTRVDDAVKAAKAALEDGVVAGGGSALLRARAKQKTPDITNNEGIGEKLIHDACQRPIEQMAENSRIRLDRSDFEAIEGDKKKTIDFTTGKVVDAFEGGIIDPLKVVTESLSNAASQAGIFLTLNAGVILEEPEKPEQI